MERLKRCNLNPMWYGEIILQMCSVHKYFTVLRWIFNGVSYYKDKIFRQEKRCLFTKLGVEAFVKKYSVEEYEQIDFENINMNEKTPNQGNHDAYSWYLKDVGNRHKLKTLHTPRPWNSIVGTINDMVWLKFLFSFTLGINTSLHLII